MDKRLAFCAALLLALASLNSHAQSIEAVTEDSSYSYLQNGKVTGPASKVAEATLQQAGLGDYHITLYPWARAYDIAQREPNVLIYPIVRTPAREKQFKWVGELARVTPILYKLREQRDIVASSLEAVKNYSVGVVRDDSRQQYLQAQGFTKMVISANNMDNFKKLLDGKVQMVPMPERDARAICDDAHVSFSDLEAVYTLDGLTADLYLAYSVATPDEVVARTVLAFGHLKANGEFARLMESQP